jgi:hypothetical protein
MFDVAESLRGAFVTADRQLREAQHRLAEAQVYGNSRAVDAALARTAGSVIFTEALLNATRARLQEIQTAAKP